ncbi:VaFE repeat-containing surface-anchored protein, partial [Corynebacterium macginleyi]|uniref:VaFE repeat-containing surface-anchored protein n=1 Tax=Corynebacterium macginleyi TaxID=38290 RepID=UPI0019091055
MAEDSQPTDFKPDENLGGTVGKDFPWESIRETWGTLTYATDHEFVRGNPENNAGWGWCIDPGKVYPTASRTGKYLKSNAEKLKIPTQYRDAAINIAMKWQEAIRKEKAATSDAQKVQYRKKAGTYVVYLQALVSQRPADRTRAVMAITGANPKYENPDGQLNYPGFIGNMEEFTELTGLKLEKAYGGPDQGGPSFTKVSDVKSYPDSFYITVVQPVAADGKRRGYGFYSFQRLIPPDQPGLPPLEEKKPEISTKAELAGDAGQVVAGAKVIDTVEYKDLVPGKQYTLKAELINKADGTSVVGKGEKTFTPQESAGKVDVEITVNDDVTEPVAAAVAFEELTSAEVNAKGEDTPDASEPNKVAEHKDIDDKDQTVTSEKKPEISTKAELAGDAGQVVAGAKVIDTVEYKDLVPGKQYTLK